MRFWLVILGCFIFSISANAQQIQSSKLNSYGVIQGAQIGSSKLNSYGLLEGAVIKSSKLNGYVVILSLPSGGLIPRSPLTHW